MPRKTKDLYQLTLALCSTDDERQEGEADSSGIYEQARRELLALDLSLPFGEYYHALVEIVNRVAVEAGEATWVCDLGGPLEKEENPA